MVTDLIHCIRHTESTLRDRSIRRRRQLLKLGCSQGPQMDPEGSRLSYAVSCVTFPALGWTPMLHISVGPNTKRLLLLPIFFWHKICSTSKSSKHMNKDFRVPADLDGFISLCEMTGGETSHQTRQAYTIH